MVDDNRIDSDNASMPSQRARPEGQAEEVAELAVCAWQSLADRLSPIIGKRGFRALYARSLHLNQDAYPWLSLPPPQSPASEPFFGSLRRSLGLQDPTVAADAHRALLRTFTGLLNSLIGKVLTARLVQEAPLEGSSDGRSQESRK
ncbi:MAG: hypothetical protein ACXW20_06750 [Burkholderiales bacterium]